MSKKEQDQSLINDLKVAYSGLNPKVENGAIDIDGTDVFEKHLPEGVTPDGIKSLQNYITNTLSAVHEVNGEIAIGAMAGDDALNEVKATVKLGTLGVEKSSYSRMIESKNIKDGSVIQTWGASRASISILGGAVGNRYETAKSAVKAMGEDKLKK